MYTVQLERLAAQPGGGNTVPACLAMHIAVAVQLYLRAMMWVYACHVQRAYPDKSLGVPHLALLVHHKHQPPTAFLVIGAPPNSHIIQLLGALCCGSAETLARACRLQSKCLN